MKKMHSKKIIFKIFIKLSERFGYEIIDQNNLYHPTSKNLRCKILELEMKSQLVYP